MGAGKPIHHCGGSTLEIAGAAVCWLAAVSAIASTAAEHFSQLLLQAQSLAITSASCAFYLHGKRTHESEREPESELKLPL
jgi:hypothetical protein